MPIEHATTSRISALIAAGNPMSPAGKKGSGLTYDEEQAIGGWLTSAINAVQMIEGNLLNAYGNKCISIRVKYENADVLAPTPARERKMQCVGEMVSTLQNLLVDVNAGMISSLEDRVRGEVFDDFLDHADEYHRAGRKESGVIAGVVFEDTMRRLAAKNGLLAGDMETLINELVKKQVISSTKAKRAKAAAHVRTKATHAQWGEFDLKDVADTIGLTRELIEGHLTR